MPDVYSYLESLKLRFVVIRPLILGPMECECWNCHYELVDRHRVPAARYRKLNFVEHYGASSDCRPLFEISIEQNHLSGKWFIENFPTITWHMVKPCCGFVSMDERVRETFHK